MINNYHSFGGSNIRGVTPRQAAEGDFAEISAIARASFPIPRWLFEVPANLAHYSPHYHFESKFGVMNILVAVDLAERVCGYIYYQLRNDGDVYIRELASHAQGARIKGVGTLLLSRAVAAARFSRARVTTNVLKWHRQNNEYWRDPCAYYEKLGLSIVIGETGYCADGTPRRKDDTWLAGPLPTVLGATQSLLRRLEQ